MAGNYQPTDEQPSTVADGFGFLDGDDDSNEPEVPDFAEQVGTLIDSNGDVSEAAKTAVVKTLRDAGALADETQRLIAALDAYGIPEPVHLRVVNAVRHRPMIRQEVAAIVDALDVGERVRLTTPYGEVVRPVIDAPGTASDVACPATFGRTGDPIFVTGVRDEPITEYDVPVLVHSGSDVRLRRIERLGVCADE